MSDRPLRLRAAARSDVGRVRSANEDSFIERPDMCLWVVADGMGGHANGQWASRAIVDAVSRVAPSGDFDADIRRVADAIHAANATIYHRASEDGAQMGSTVAALLVQEGFFAALWVGDSRIYLYRDGTLHQLTRDHTQVQEMVEAGLLDAAEAKSHPMGHVLARAVGVQESLEIDVIVDEAEVGDTFLLCSDGITAVISNDEIARAMAGPPQPATAIATLVELCLERGAPDNVTTIAVACEEITRLSQLSTAS
jgi:serine/threonine protein phosphatase PrpC